jgi:hypothetical protein
MQRLVCVFFLEVRTHQAHRSLFFSSPRKNSTPPPNHRISNCRIWQPLCRSEAVFCVNTLTSKHGVDGQSELMARRTAPLWFITGTRQCSPHRMPRVSARHRRPWRHRLKIMDWSARVCSTRLQT